MRFTEKILSNIIHVFFGITRPMTIGVRCIIHDGAGSVMLVRHTYVSGWHLPGGGVNVGETCEAALIREVAEESNMDLTGKPVLFGVYLNSLVSARDHVILYISDSCNYKEGLSSTRLEIAESRMFKLTELPISIDPSTLKRLDEWRGVTAKALIW